MKRILYWIKGFFNIAIGSMILLFVLIFTGFNLKNKNFIKACDWMDKKLPLPENN